MNPIVYAKILGGLGIVTIIGLAYMHYQGLIDDRTELTTRVQSLNASIEQYRQREAGYLATITGITHGMGRLNEKLAEARTSLAETRRIFGDHDFESLARKKPGLITIKMKKATAKVFSEIEGEANE